LSTFTRVTCRYAHIERRGKRYKLPKTRYEPLKTRYERLIKHYSLARHVQFAIRDQNAALVVHTCVCPPLFTRVQGRSNLADIVKLLRRCTDAMRASVPDLDLVKKLTISEEDVHIRLTVLLCFKHVRSHIDWAVEWSGLSEDEVLARLARDEESYTPSSATLKLREINKQATSFPSPNMFFKYYLKNADVFEHILKFLT